MPGRRRPGRGEIGEPGGIPIHQNSARASQNPGQQSENRRSEPHHIYEGRLIKLHKKVIHELMVQPGEAADLKSRDTAETRTHWRDHTAKSSPRVLADNELGSFRSELAAAQELLYASDTSSLLMLLQALDAAGKDGTIRHVMSGVNP
jgi:polyphosphate kinase 2 (PPK2 family)